MKRPLFPFLMMAIPLCASSLRADPAERPEGVPSSYELVYQQDFSDADCMGDFQFTDPQVWRLGKSDDGSTFVEHFAQSKYKYKVRSPLNICLLSKGQVRDFVLDLEMQQTGKNYNHRDLCVFFGFQEPSHFYYTHIATKTDPHAHNIFIVNNEPRTKISQTTTEGHDWGKGWHTVRLARDSASGQIKVFVNDMKKPIMTAEDKTFDWGFVGFGSFDDTGRVRRMRLWSPQLRPAKPISFQAGSAGSQRP